MHIDNFIYQKEVLYVMITQHTLMDMRKQANLTIKETADACHIATRTLQNWEKGEVIPDIVSILDLLALYKRNFAELDLQPFYNAKEERIRKKEKERVRLNNQDRERVRVFPFQSFELINGKGF